MSGGELRITGGFRTVVGVRRDLSGCLSHNRNHRPETVVGADAADGEDRKIFGTHERGHQSWAVHLDQAPVRQRRGHPFLGDAGDAGKPIGGSSLVACLDRRTDYPTG